jgi:hypothetical protein
MLGWNSEETELAVHQRSGTVLTFPVALFFLIGFSSNTAQRWIALTHTQKERNRGKFYILRRRERGVDEFAATRAVVDVGRVTNWIPRLFKRAIVSCIHLKTLR